MKAQLIKTEPVNGTDYLGRFYFRPEKPILFLPGQYVTLGISRPSIEEAVDLQRSSNDIKRRDGKPTVLRPYSVASAPESELIELYVIRVDKDGRRKDGRGVLTTELFNPHENAEYSFLEKAAGVFTLPEHTSKYPNLNDTRTRIMVATGTGIAPYMSMLRSPNTQTKGRKFVLIHGVSNARDHAYKADLAKIISDGVDLSYIPIASREATEGQKYVEEVFFNRGDRLKTGRVTDEEVKRAIEQEQLHNTSIEKAIGHKLSWEDDIIMVCGNPGMINSLEAIATAIGFKPKADFKTEEYWPVKA